MLSQNLDSLWQLQSSRHLYEQDFFLWTQTLAEVLRSGNQIDIENLAKELESLGQRDRRELRRRLTLLLVHLLKWQFQPHLRSRHWHDTFAIQRIQIQNLLKESPSLRSFLESSINDCYKDAKQQTAEETGLPITTFPQYCPVPVRQAILSEEKILERHFAKTQVFNV
jgi:NRPS condensation-like uncharacterized protein